MIEQLQHPLFRGKFKDLGFPFMARTANRFLSVGGVCYYLNDSRIKTRVYIYNYFSLLNGGPFPVEWTLRVYSTDGTKWTEKKGELAESQTIAIDLDTMARDLSTFGLCVMHLYPARQTQSMKNSFTTHFFVEYSTSNAEALLHSLGHLVPKLHKAEDYITSSIREDGDPVLLVGNCCYRSLHYPKAIREQRIHIEILNFKRETRRFRIAPIPPLGCQQIHLRETWPDIDTWLGGKPALIRLCGPNILYSPLIMQSAKDGFIGLDHFQGLDWDEYDANAPAC
jgi:hypothetical protein